MPNWKIPNGFHYLLKKRYSLGRVKSVLGIDLKPSPDLTISLKFITPIIFKSLWASRIRLLLISRVYDASIDGFLVFEHLPSFAKVRVDLTISYRQIGASVQPFQWVFNFLARHISPSSIFVYFFMYPPYDFSLENDERRPHCGVYPPVLTSISNYRSNNLVFQ